MSQTTSHQDSLMNQEYSAFIGIDWADQKHDIATKIAGQKRATLKTIEHSPEALSQWVNDLRRRFGSGKIAICLEQSKGALINFLISHDFITLYPINPKTLAKFREAFRPSKAKNDPTDTELILEILLKHLNQLRPWKPDNALVRTISILAEKRRNAVDQRKATSNQLKSLLKGYFPQALDLVSEDLYMELSCQFLLKWPTLQVLQKAKKNSIEKFYRTFHCYKQDVINRRLEIIEKTTALTTDSAILDTSPIELKMLVKVLQQLTSSISEYDKQLATLYPSHPYANIFSSFPGAGPVNSARLASAFGTDKDRYQKPEDIHVYSGVAPITVQSGKSHWVAARYFCPKYLRQTFIEYAGQSIKSSIWAKAFYTMQQKKGKKHHVILRALAFKWIRIMFRCWKNNKAYDELAYLKSLKKRGSEVLKHLAT